MKKWLNIKPKEYDFSADEVETETETETETEDDGMVSGFGFLLPTLYCFSSILWLLHHVFAAFLFFQLTLIEMQERTHARIMVFGRSIRLAKVRFQVILIALSVNCSCYEYIITTICALCFILS